MTRLDKLLSSRGYCSRSETKMFLKRNEVLIGGEQALSPDQKVDPSGVVINGEPIDPGEGIILMLHKPCGFTCSHSGEGEVIYDLLPERYTRRNPKIVSVGRLDKDSSGLLILTDDGKVVHKLTSPKHHVAKVYEVSLARGMRGDEKELFESGAMMLESEDTPLKPALLEVLGETHARISLFEGRYHQVRRMFAATGNHVESLKRIQIGKLSLEDLEEGEFRAVSLGDILPEGTQVRPAG